MQHKRTTAPQPHMSRRTVLGGLAGAVACAATPLGAAAARRPNFLYIMADDLGYADLSCYGRTDYRTPELDRLASQGMRFTSAYSNSAVCTATRVGLITGRYQYRVPIGLEEPLGVRRIGLPPSHPTIASLLRQAGYATSLIGKWHLGPLPDYGPLQSGYDEFWGLRGGAIDYFNHSFQGQRDLWDGDTPIEKIGYSTDLLADRTIESFKRFAATDKPWFISMHLTAPHWPWEGPEDEAVARQLAASKDPTALFHFDGGTMATFANMVTSMDRNVGRVLRALRAQGLDRNTVVVFTSDNGGERFSKTWPFSGKKTDLLEGGIRVPAIVRWPGLTRAGSQSDAQIISMDWLPTFLAAAGGAPDAAYPLDGVDIRSALAGGSLPERSLYWRYKHNAQEAVRRGNFKYLKVRNNTFLFDVVADPMERGNLKARLPEKFAELSAAWKAWNATMLPHDPESQSHGFTSGQLVDYVGVDL
jgi:arylsulfatase A-like enzyme